MTGLTRCVRGVGLALAGTVSLVCGLLLTERLVRPDVIGYVDTTILLGLILMLVLPALTFLAIRHDSRVLARTRPPIRPRTRPPETGLTPEASIEQRTVLHTAHGRGLSGARKKVRIDTVTAG